MTNLDPDGEPLAYGLVDGLSAQGDVITVAAEHQAGYRAVGTTVPHGPDLSPCR